MPGERPGEEPAEAGHVAPAPEASTGIAGIAGMRAAATPGAGPRPDVGTGMRANATTGRPGGPDDLLDRLQRAERDRRSLLRQLLTAQEDERRRLAGDLHDDAIQSLAAALLHLDVLEALLERAGAVASAGVGEGVGRVRENLEHALRAARAFLFDLHPHLLEAEGLRAALELQLKRLAEAGCATELVWSLEDRVDGDLETVLFRALQEALANVAKHARATTVRVRVRSEGVTVVAQVDDDGVGFDPVETRVWAMATGHLGLRFMVERVEAAGGDVRIDSALGQGAHVTLWLPSEAAPTARNAGPGALGGRSPSASDPTSGPR